MRKTLLALTLVSALTACGEDTPMSQEEIYMMDIYARISGAFAYDMACAGNTLARDEPSMLSANMNMIATQVYQSLRANHPQTPDAELQKATIESGDNMRASAAAIVKEKGCDAEELVPFKVAHTRFSTVGPDDNYTFMMKDMEKLKIERKAAPLVPIKPQGPQSTTPVKQSPPAQNL